MCDGTHGLTALLVQPIVRLAGGSVHGLRLSASTEPEVALCKSHLHVPRLVAPYATRSIAFNVAFSALGRLLGVHTAQAMKALDMERLDTAYVLLEALCQQYLHEAVRILDGVSSIPAWYHQLLFAWFLKQPPLCLLYTSPSPRDS